MHVKCTTCGHEWDYNGQYGPEDVNQLKPRNYISCSKCSVRLPLTDRIIVDEDEE